MRIASLGGFVAVFCLLFITPLHGGTAVRMELEDLVDRSTLLVEGRVVSARALRDTRGRIVTEFGLQLSDTYWGRPAAFRLVRLPGGVLEDGSGMWIPGMPRVRVGEQWILALCESDPTGMCMPVGLAQGALRVVRTKQGKKRVLAATAGLHTLDPKASEAGALAGTVGYAEVRSRLTAACERRRVAPRPVEEAR